MAVMQAIMGNIGDMSNIGIEKNHSRWSCFVCCDFFAAICSKEESSDIFLKFKMKMRYGIMSL